MARYLVIFTPDPEKETDVAPPANLEGLARASVSSTRGARWIRSWSPDLHDERTFSLWEADDAAEVTATMARFNFLHHGEILALRVREWDPHDVIAAATADEA